MVLAPKRHRVSMVWIIPILAALVAISIAVHRIRSEGPTITIVFKAADGIEVGKTFIKYKDVNLGQVTDVHLSNDYSQVVVTAKMTSHAAALLVDDAKFWVVRPTISLSGISGLNTLLSGNYIGFEAGTSKQSQDEFTGLEKPPLISGQLGREFILKSHDLGSLSEGSPVFFRRVPVGQVVSFAIADDGASVEIRVFVNAPYDKHVMTSTRFWNAGGVDITTDANGIGIRTESIVAALVGGIAFDVPNISPGDTVAPSDAQFVLYSDRPAAMKAPIAGSRHYVLHFSETLRGLSVGAPVTFLGLPAGEVTEIDLELDKSGKNVRPRVTVTFYPEGRLSYTDASQKTQTTGDDKRRGGLLRRLIEERGLRAQLRRGNLLTGQTYVAFEYFPNADKASTDWSRDLPELPVMKSSVVEIEDKLTSVLAKIDKLPIEDLGRSLNLDLKEFHKVLVGTGKIIGRVDEELLPALNANLDAMQRALVSIERGMNHADANVLSPDAPAQQELRDALSEFTRASTSMRILFDYLERHPESVIRGKPSPKSGDK
jgi:paraquat-inducible protein B